MRKRIMKKFATIAGMGLLMWVMFTGCDSKRKPGKIYMPDMAYSRSYETYAEYDSSIITNDPADKGGNKIFYNSQPVAGTIKRGELFPYTIPNDTNGYKLSATVMNPITEMTKAEMDETARLFNINCAICHGEKGLGNGPISTSGKIGGIANLTLQQYIDMADGTMFHSLTYGRNLMGSYASQLDRKQRWMIVKYIRSLQPKPTVEAAKAVAKTDSTAIAVKK
jgi:mono/diheme cytochrome c family protein